MKQSSLLKITFLRHFKPIHFFIEHESGQMSGFINKPTMSFCASGCGSSFLQLSLCGEICQCCRCWICYKIMKKMS